MDEVRKGQIAPLLIKQYLYKKGVRLSPNLRYDIEKGAESLGISHEEGRQFFELVIREMVEEAFADKK